MALVCQLIFGLDFSLPVMAMLIVLKVKIGLRHLEYPQNYKMVMRHKTGIENLTCGYGCNTPRGFWTFVRDKTNIRVNH